MSVYTRAFDITLGCRTDFPIFCARLAVRGLRAGEVLLHESPLLVYGEAEAAENGVFCSRCERLLSSGLSYQVSGGLLVGDPGRQAALSITSYMNRAGYCRQRNYYSKFTLL
jgi:hypothetical protein